MEMYKPKIDRAKQFWSELQQLWLNLYGSNYPTAAAIIVSNVYTLKSPLQSRSMSRFLVKLSMVPGKHHKDVCTESLHLRVI